MASIRRVEVGVAISNLDHDVLVKHIADVCPHLADDDPGHVVHRIMRGDPPGRALSRGDFGHATAAR